MSSPPSVPGKDGRAARWAGQRERRRSEFVEAALRAIAEHGADVSTEQIAAEAGVARTQLYKHFADATDLRWAIADRAKELLTGAIGLWSLRGTPMEMIRNGVEAHMNWLSGHRHLYRYLTRHSLAVVGHQDPINDARTDIGQQLSAMLGGYMRMFGVEAKLADPVSFAVVGMVDAATARWLDHPGRVSHAELAELLAGWAWGLMDGVLRGAGVTLDPNAPLRMPPTGPGDCPVLPRD